MEEAVRVRRAEADDQVKVQSLISADGTTVRARWGRVNVASLIESSYLSVTAVNAEGELIGFASFLANPPSSPDFETWIKWASDAFNLDGVTIHNNLFLSFFIFSPRASAETSEADVMESILRSALSTLPDVDHILCLIPKDIAPYSALDAFDALPYHRDYTPEVASSSSDYSEFDEHKVVKFDRTRFIPNLSIRVAMVEDHDDLVPVFNAQSDVLTELYGEFFLAEMIAAQDENNKALVAQVDDRAVGLMALSSDIDFSVLQQCFELEPYDNLLKVEEKEEPSAEEQKPDAEKQAVGISIFVPFSLAGDGYGRQVVEQSKSNLTYVDVAETLRTLAEGWGDDNPNKADCLVDNLEIDNLPNDFVAETLATYLSSLLAPDSGFVVENYPRNELQAEALAAAGVNLQVCLLEVPSEELEAAEVGPEVDLGTVLEDWVVLDTFARATYGASGSSFNTVDGSADSAGPAAVLMLGCIVNIAQQPVEEDLGEVDEVEAELNAFAITLFCLDELYESRAQDFMEQAFKQYPGKDYCVLTLPPTSAETALLSQFTVVPMKPTSHFSHCVYLCHRDSLFSRSVVVRRLTRVDMPAIRPLVEGQDLRATLNKALDLCHEEEDTSLADNPGLVAFVATIANQIVGLAVVSRQNTTSDDVNVIKQNFDIEKFVNFSHHRARNQAVLSHMVLNPIFQKQTRLFLRETMRLYRKSLLYSMHYPSTPVPTHLCEMVPVKPRELAQARPEGSVAHCSEAPADRKSPGDASDSIFEQGIISLHFITSKLISEPKVVNNARIVVVGGTDTALALLESLILLPYMHFTSLILVTPNGPAAAGSGMSPTASTSYTDEDLQRISFNSRVRMVDLPLVDIDREGKAIVLDGEIYLPYDYLVLTSEHCDTSERKLENDTRPLGLHFIKGSNSSVWIEEDVNGWVIPQQVPVVVYGDSVRSLAVVGRLLDYGVNGNLITLVCPQDAKWLAESSMDSLIEQKLQESGVTIKSNLTLQNFDTRPSSSGDVMLQSVSLVPTASLVSRKSAASILDGSQFKYGGGANPAEGNPGSNESVVLECGFMVCANNIDVDSQMFQAINESGLVFDGRLVVNNRFQTCDPSIYGGGALTRFSRRHRYAIWHENYNERELGGAVAAALLEVTDPMSEPEDVARNTEMPFFALSSGTSQSLIGGLHYAYLTIPQVNDECRKLTTSTVGQGLTDLTKGPPPNGTQSVSTLYVDSHGRAVAFAYLGNGPLELKNMARVVGQQEAFLNSCEKLYDQGLIPDWVTFFREDWVQAVYHDGFPEFTMNVRMGMQDDEGIRSVLEEVKKALEAGESDAEICLKRRQAIGKAGDALAPSTKKMIETNVIEYLKKNRNVLRMYYMPGTKSQTK
jgi:hypothetical protein